MNVGGSLAFKVVDWLQVGPVFMSTLAQVIQSNFMTTFQQPIPRMPQSITWNNITFGTVMLMSMSRMKMTRMVTRAKLTTSMRQGIVGELRWDLDWSIFPKRTTYKGIPHSRGPECSHNPIDKRTESRRSLGRCPEIDINTCCYTIWAVFMTWRVSVSEKSRSYIGREGEVKKTSIWYRWLRPCTVLCRIVGSTTHSTDRMPLKSWNGYPIKSGLCRMSRLEDDEKFLVMMIHVFLG